MQFDAHGFTLVDAMILDIHKLQKLRDDLVKLTLSGKDREVI
jgi:hypothetical protein